ncbi:replication/maintenance protein RepL [Magnetospirillum molischianum]|uniref:Plasmid replication protein RepL domain-containing protein n=1 Tax=Magnetospirillum molischianum DSM 120 TaxID=1150626 RepID=H8FNI5_MAGML|nr:replication/maintenance protein RepL [Magnetospirillum molischianum]CCG39923.1 conserved hypothetical protein [Magnetospirillum molischianum DSM 120]
MSEKKSVHALKRAFSPMVNPFLEPVTVEITAKAKRRYVRTSTSQQLVDPETGEVKAVSMIHTVEDRDDESFVKVFAEGVKMAFGLGSAGTKVFQAVLDAYQKEKMTGGYADCLTLFWFDNGLNGEAIGMSERTFNRGIKELLEKEFLIPRSPNQYWVNPSLFFKGDRVAFVKEYRRRASPKAVEGV